MPMLGCLLQRREKAVDLGFFPGVFNRTGHFQLKERLRQIRLNLSENTIFSLYYCQLSGSPAGPAVFVDQSFEDQLSRRFIVFKT
jgi:hypothetical protein